MDEGLGDNHYNCPVVAYYPEVLAGNCPELEGTKFIYDYVGIIGTVHHSHGQTPHRQNQSDKTEFSR